MDRKVEETVQSSMPGEGEDPISEEEKHMLGLKAKFIQTTRSFHAPDLAAQHRAKMDRLAKHELKSGGDRATSAMGSSNKDTSLKDDKSASGAPKEYFPLAPEQWREKIREFK